MTCVKCICLEVAIIKARRTSTNRKVKWSSSKLRWNGMYYLCLVLLGVTQREDLLSLFIKLSSSYSLIICLSPTETNDRSTKRSNYDISYSPFILCDSYYVHTIILIRHSQRLYSRWHISHRTQNIVRQPGRSLFNPAVATLAEFVE